ncbi:conserved transmembrane alanine RICH protein, partial [Rhodococcus sp. IITR03]
MTRAASFVGRRDWQDGPVPMPLDRPTVSRRTLLRWSSVAVGGFGITTITACAPPTRMPPEPDPLASQATRARTD